MMETSKVPPPSVGEGDTDVAGHGGGAVTLVIGDNLAVLEHAHAGVDGANFNANRSLLTHVSFNWFSCNVVRNALMFVGLSLMPNVRDLVCAQGGIPLHDQD